MIAGNHGQKVRATRPGYKRDLISDDRESFFTKGENGVRPVSGVRRLRTRCDTASSAQTKGQGE